MSNETLLQERLAKILAADGDTLKKVDRVLAGDTPTDEQPRARLLNFKQAADMLGLSRVTIWRLVNDGSIPVVELRPGFRRIAEADILKIVQSRAEARA